MEEKDMPMGTKIGLVIIVIVIAIGLLIGS